MGFSISNSLALRSFYSNTPTLAISSNRKEATTGALSSADSKALRSAIKRLRDYDFESSDDSSVQQKLRAFVDTYNNTVSTGSKYGVNDTAVKNAVKKMKSLSSEYSDELKKIGITVDKKTGYMEISDTVGKNYKKDKFTSFFSDKDNEYLNGIYNAARHMTHRIDITL